MPTELARDLLIRDLTWLSRGFEAARVLTWDDLWEEVRVQAHGPCRPSSASLRGVLIEAIDRENRSGRLKYLGDAALSAGFRRRILAKFAAWGRAGRDPAGPPPGTDRMEGEEWGIYGRYSRLLSELGARDAEGLKNWATARFAKNPPPGLREFGRVHVLEPGFDRRVLETLAAFHERSDGLVVTLEYDDQPIPREVFFEADSLRDTLLEWGFDEDSVDPDPARPVALAHLGQALFQNEPFEPSRASDGVKALGAPEGDGIALVVAHRVRELLLEGADPSEILVVVPRLDESASRMGETLETWQIAAVVEGERPVAADPAVSAIRGAMMIPVLGWDATRLIRLLRNGNLRPRWPEIDTPRSLSATAEAIRRTKAHRGKKAIRDALRRAGADPSALPKRWAEAVSVFDRLAAALEACHKPGTWASHADHLEGLARDLGIAATEGLDRWFLAIDDHGALFNRLGKGGETWSWEEFAREADAIARESCIPPPCRPGAVRVTSPARCEGVGVRHLIVANMAEGTFPTRAAIEGDADPLCGPLGREQARFLRLIASARESLSLVYPTADEKGLKQAASGFLDDVKQAFTGRAWEAIEVCIGRLDPVLPESLAMAPAEARVRAVHRACNLGRFEELDALLRDDAHRRVLQAAARSLRLAHWRSRRERFGPYDGQIGDARIREAVAAEFAADRAVLSASHLETFALCPFQFFQKYVLKLEAPDDREELDDDLTLRGSLLHKALERLHIQLRDAPDDSGREIADRVDAQIGPAILSLMDARPEASSAIEEGLRAIEDERLRRIGRSYVHQFRKYAQKDGRGAVSRHFEVAFGKPGGEHPPLRIGEAPRSIALQGVIDRIDMVDRDGVPMFRVIDYKTGSLPKDREIQAGEKLQLSLYALAAERVILAEPAAPLDAAYWGLRETGFRRMHTMTAPDGVADASWSRFAASLEGFILTLVDRLRHADFPVAPRLVDCARLCDYRFVCRVDQVRRAGKVWGDLPRLGDHP